MEIQESTENCLEAILILSCKNPYVCFIDIASELVFSRPSVDVAMKNLRENSYILMNDQGYITLNNMGKEITETMCERHTVFSQWLMYLGMDEQTAVEGACRIGHVVSAESLWTIKDHITKGHEFPRDNL